LGSGYLVTYSIYSYVGEAVCVFIKGRYLFTFSGGGYIVTYIREKVHGYLCCANCLVTYMEGGCLVIYFGEGECGYLLIFMGGGGILFPIFGVGIWLPILWGDVFVAISGSGYLITHSAWGGNLVT
jgi:hypothetical protein